MENLLKVLIILPIIGYILSFFTSSKKENQIYMISILTVISQFLSFSFLGILWGLERFPDIYSLFFNIYRYEKNHYLSISLFFDSLTCAYLFVTFIVTFSILLFSRTYMHRDPGYKRFFNNTLLFYLGLNFILLSGNFETLFVGWEMIGVSSFFLISFYRERYLPSKNALKVVSIYRIADIFLLFGIYLIITLIKVLIF